MHHSLALDRLKEGNKRFVSGLRSIDAIAASSGRRKELADEGQKPFAMILSCADSRVPAEMIFDCGLGDLFVVRVAGNIVAPSLIGSLEFAAENFGTALCVVMGHSQCGAVASAVKSITSETRPDSDNIQQIVLEIAPSVKKTLDYPGAKTEEFLISACTQHNVQNSVAALQQRSRVLSKLVQSGKLMIAGAFYNLRSGEVHFLDQPAGKDQPVSHRNQGVSGTKLNHQITN